MLECLKVFKLSVFWDCYFALPVLSVIICIQQQPRTVDIKSQIVHTREFSYIIMAVLTLCTKFVVLILLLCVAVCYRGWQLMLKEQDSSCIQRALVLCKLRALEGLCGYLNFTYLLSHLLTYSLTYLLTYFLSYLLT